MAEKETPKTKKVTTKTESPKKTVTKKTTTKPKTKIPKVKESKSKMVKKEVGQTKKEPANIKILGFNNLPLNTYVYEKVESPKAVVVIVHGMQEHCLRYKDFAEHLNKNGFIAIASDLRGHGRTAESKEHLGFGEEDIFVETLEDQINIINFAKEAYDLPIYLFGHSYGSMLGQNIIQKTQLVEKCVLCGTMNGGSAIMKLGKIAVNCLSPFKKEYSKGGLLEKMCIKSYGKKFERGNWLTRDEKIFDEYLKDEYCGGSFPFSFYKSLIKNMNKTNKRLEKVGNKKILFIAGDKDPVGANGKQVKKLYKVYLKHNINAKIKIYKDARHELLNEINKDEVYKDIVDFYNN